MSLPRYIVPGVTYLLTRRCFGRQFLLRPSAEVNQIFEFCLAVAAARSGCEVHAYCVLSNHYHLVVTDPDGKLPVFMHWLNEYVAKCVNSVLGRWESFWAPGSYSQVSLADEEDVMAKLVYTMTNPVSAGLAVLRIGRAFGCLSPRDLRDASPVPGHVQWAVNANGPDTCSHISIAFRRDTRGARFGRCICRPL